MFVSALTSSAQQLFIICSNHFFFLLFSVFLTFRVTSVIITHPLISQSVFVPPLLCLFDSPSLLSVLGPSAGRGNLRPQLDSAMQDVSDLYLLMEETEKQAVRRALLEDRGRYCSFINLLQPVVVSNTHVSK